MEAEQKRIGSQHLDAILNQSGQILEAQHLNLLQSGLSRHHSGSGSVSDDMSDDESENESEPSEVDGDDDSMDDGAAVDESSEGFSEVGEADSSALLQWPGSLAMDDDEVPSEPEEAEEESRSMDYGREEEDEEDDDDVIEGGDPAEEQSPVDETQEFVTESYFDHESVHSDKETEVVSNGDLENTPLSFPSQSFAAVLGGQRGDIALMTDEILDVAPTPSTTTNGFQTPTVDFHPLTNGFSSQSPSLSNLSGILDSVEDEIRIQPDEVTELIAKPTNKILNVSDVSRNPLAQETLGFVPPSDLGVANGSSDRNQTFDSGIEIPEANDEVVQARLRNDALVPEQVGADSSRVPRSHEKEEEEESIEQTDSPAQMIDEEELVNGKVSEVEEPWEVPDHLRPFAVARVDWHAEDKLKPPLLLRGNLRPYQQSGLEWLATLHIKEMNGILADEMGLGFVAVIFHS